MTDTNPLTLAGAIGIIGSLILFIRQLYELRLKDQRERYETNKVEVREAHAAIVADLRDRLAESEQRSDRYEALALRTLAAAQEAAHVATELTKRGSS